MTHPLTDTRHWYRRGKVAAQADIDAGRDLTGIDHHDHSEAMDEVLAHLDLAYSDHPGAAPEELCAAQRAARAGYRDRACRLDGVDDELD